MNGQRRVSAGTMRAGPGCPHLLLILFRSVLVAIIHFTQLFHFTPAAAETPEDTCHILLPTSAQHYAMHILNIATMAPLSAVKAAHSTHTIPQAAHSFPHDLVGSPHPPARPQMHRGLHHPANHRTSLDHAWAQQSSGSWHEHCYRQHRLCTAPTRPHRLCTASHTILLVHLIL